MKADLRIALIGNPNTGKSTLFNLLTGLNQKIGNFPGITVDRKTGHFKLPSGREALVTDLPGTYSLYPKSRDEAIVFQVLADKTDPSYPDVVVVVADATNLRRNLLLYTQVADLGIPTLLALNMSDLATKQGIDINVNELSSRLGVRVVPISARINVGTEVLKEAIDHTTSSLQNQLLDIFSIAPEAVVRVKLEFDQPNDYFALQTLHQHDVLTTFSEAEQDRLDAIVKDLNFNSTKLQTEEIELRYRALSKVLTGVINVKVAREKFMLTEKIDAIVTHKIWGFAIFLLLLFFIFNAIFSWSSVPMDWI
ncbi:MAG: ferrous iron transporter B, partial [Sphingobacteriales bacterium]